MFYANLNQFEIDNIEKNIFDLGHNSFFLCLLPEEQKRHVLSIVNPEARLALKYILNVKDTFVPYQDAKYVIQKPEKYYEKIESYGKEYLLYSSGDTRVVYFYGADDNRSLHLHHSWNCDPQDFIFFRYGSRKTEKWTNTFGLPYIVPDKFNGIILRKRLSMSYCGYPDNFIFKKLMIKEVSQYSYSDFILRDKWGGRLVHESQNYDSYDFGPTEKRRNEFFDNMERNLYAFTIRGMNNASYRFYEAFMMGRIPVLINTDMLLPFEDEIDYRRNTVYITDFRDIDGQIRKYHDSHTEDELIQIQKENRNIWLKYFRVDSMFYNTKKLLSNYKYEKV